MITLQIKDDCIRCGRCVTVCPARILTQADDNSPVTVVNLTSCIECGQCAAICPTDSVEHSLFPPSKVHTVNKEILPSADALLEIMRRRRSNRSFTNKEVPMESLNRILEAATLAPTARNAQPLEFTLVTNPDVLKAVHEATMQVCEQVYGQLKKSADPAERSLALYSLTLMKKYKSGYEVILRGGKALIIIHSKDPKVVADANIAYQNASLMAEALGVAHFYSGYVRLYAASDVERVICNAMQIDGHILAGMVLGMPQYSFNKYIDRKEPKINRIV